jgi:hypothetical protein
VRRFRSGLAGDQGIDDDDAAWRSIGRPLPASVFWRARETRPGAFAITIAGSAIAYTLSFGAFGVAADFRYAYWCVLASLAGFVPALLARRDFFQTRAAH